MNSRRAPQADERQRDAERSKRQLMDAAVIEFAAYGFSGARVTDIATRAGVNKQLISYYFGGKQGLYEAISERWREDETKVSEPAASLPELVAAYATEAMTNPNLTRLMIRQGVDGSAVLDAAGQAERFARVVEDMRNRQAAGEFGDDLDPAQVALALFAMAAAPVTFPQIAQAVGLDPTSPSFAAEYAEQVTRIVARLASSV